MKLTLCHRSALEALIDCSWRCDISSLPRISLPNAFLSTASPLECERLGLSYRLSEPIEVICSEGSNRRNFGGLLRHRLNPRSMVAGFVELEPGLWVSSPELCFIQLCADLDEVDAIRLLGWMAATYRVDADGHLRESAPLLTRDSLGEALERHKGVHGAVRARKAMSYAPCRCASPKEIEVAMLFQLPGSLGGCGFARPQINAEQALSSEQRRLLRRNSIRCDFYWPGRGVAVEYDSTEFHVGAERIEADAIRRNDIEYLGTTVMTLGWNQLRDYDKFERFAVQLASHLGLRLRGPWERHRRERIRLHRRLLHDSPSAELVSLGYGRLWA